MGQVFSSMIGTCNCSSSTTEDDIEKMEIVRIQRRLDNIENNHLKHIEEDVREIKTDIKLINQNILTLMTK